MRAIGNFLWFVLGGVFMGLCWWALGPAGGAGGQWWPDDTPAAGYGAYLRGWRAVCAALADGRRRRLWSRPTPIRRKP